VCEKACQITNRTNAREFFKLKLNYLAPSLGSLLIYRDGFLTSSWPAFDPLLARTTCARMDPIRKSSGFAYGPLINPRPLVK